jgi:hypothetical protein
VTAALHAVPAGAPVVWVQAGHQAPREPGYTAQTGAGTGPFGSEVGFTTRVAARVTVLLRRYGVDARRTPGEVTPLGARGGVYEGLHHDDQHGTAGECAAGSGVGENW